MAKNTCISLGAHFETFIRTQITSGRFGNASEVVRAGLRLLEEHEQNLVQLRRTLADGAASGDAGELDLAIVKRKAREVATARQRRDKTRRQ